MHVERWKSWFTGNFLLPQPLLITPKWGNFFVRNKLVILYERESSYCTRKKVGNWKVEVQLYLSQNHLQGKKLSVVILKTWFLNPTCIKLDRQGVTTCDNFRKCTQGSQEFSTFSCVHSRKIMSFWDIWIVFEINENYRKNARSELRKFQFCKYFYESYFESI